MTITLESSLKNNLNFIKNLPLLIIIRGAPAVGKTSVSKTLQKIFQENDLNCATLGWDIIWDEIYRWKEPIINKDEQKVIDSTASIFKCANVICSQNPNIIIVDGVFSESDEIKLIENFATNFSKAYFFRLVTNYQEQIERNSKRDEAAFVSENKISTLNDAYLSSKIENEVLLINENISLKDLSIKILDHITTNLEDSKDNINKNITLSKNWLLANNIRFSSDRILNFDKFYFAKNNNVYNSLFYFDLPKDLENLKNNLKKYILNFSFRFKYLNLNPIFSNFNDYIKDLLNKFEIPDISIKIEDSWDAPILKLEKNDDLDFYLSNCSKRFSRTYKKIKNLDILNYKDSRNFDPIVLWRDLLTIDQDCWKKDEKSDMVSLDREDLQYLIPILNDPINNRLLVAYSNSNIPIAYTIMCRANTNSFWYNAKWGCRKDFRKSNCGIICLIKNINMLFDEHIENNLINNPFILDFWGRKNDIYNQLSNYTIQRAHILISK